MHKLFLFLLLSVMLIGCNRAQTINDDDALRRDIAKMLMVGFRGTDLNNTCHIVRDIRDYGIGGVILFEYDGPSKSRPRNITSREQLGRLCKQMQELSEERLLIGIDQEGVA